ncbi:hypothetical protein GDO86_002897 [Hymenochirus boettgeri]|uniref:Uncharacterized protein n=1 Tax=Hymenochirus boettgeri TaxID=247094 RepID=A0A8T2JZ06_9PIPI|nr:hypothetical protein GDO86_002897 [Hymenochirus boettgeri]
MCGVLEIWKEFASKLNDAIEQQMSESNIKLFTDLSESEKGFMLDKAAKALHAGDIYKKVSACISSCLEDNVYSFVANEIENSDVLHSQSDLVTRNIQDGVMSILEKRPALKVKLRILFNQRLSASLRHLTWRLQLSNPKARVEYLKQVSMNKDRSLLDREISLRCQDLLSTVHTFHHLKDNQSVVRSMRNVLSYYHKLLGVQSSLPEQAYLLLLPLIQALMDNSTSGTSLDSASSQLVEQYVTFMDGLPPFMKTFYSHEKESFSHKGIYEEMAQMLKRIDQNLTLTIENIYSTLARSPEDALLLAMAIEKMLQPVLLGLFHSELESVMKTQGPALSTEHFQMIINKFFYSDLFNLLNKGESSQLPVYDPTQATTQWRHISSTGDQSRTRPQDRRRAREERETLRVQLVEKQKMEEQIQRFHEQEQQRQQQERLSKQLEDTKKSHEAQRANLHNQLMQERQQSYEKQKMAETKISELQGEIRRLKQQRRTSVGGISMESLIVPPPSANSLALGHQPRHQTPPEKQPD